VRIARPQEKTVKIGGPDPGAVGVWIRDSRNNPDGVFACGLPGLRKRLSRLAGLTPITPTDPDHPDHYMHRTALCTGHHLATWMTLSPLSWVTPAP